VHLRRESGLPEPRPKRLHRLPIVWIQSEVSHALTHVGLTLEQASWKGDLGEAAGA
jgi:hypothetical protein